MLKCLAVLALVLSHAADTGAPVPVAAPAVSPQADKQAPPEMVTYYLGFLKKGPKWTAERTPELAKLQEAHLAHMRKMHEAGKLIVAGPLADNGDIRGIVVYKTASIEEARALTEEDPAVQAGRLAIEFHPWMVQKGVLPEPVK